MADTQPDRATTRRSLLASALGGLGVVAASPLREAQSAPGRLSATWTLRASPTGYTFPDGTTLPFFRLEHDGAGTNYGLIPVVEATEGDAVTLQIDNQLPIAVRPALLGVADGPLIRAGQAAQFTFTMPPAGSYLIGRAESRRSGPGALHAIDPRRPMSGFSALTISRPVSGANELWTGGPTYDREYYILYEDADDRWNAVMSNPRGPYRASRTSRTISW